VTGVFLFLVHMGSSRTTGLDMQLDFEHDTESCILMNLGIDMYVCSHAITSWL
jgi:hypothetical protein